MPQKGGKKPFIKKYVTRALFDTILKSYIMGNAQSFILDSKGES